MEWQHELVKELKSVSAGKVEKGESVDELNKLIEALETTPANKAFVVDRLKELQLAFFAYQLDSNAYHNRAELVKKEAEVEQS